jgi:hypothetical protein
MVNARPVGGITLAVQRCSQFAMFFIGGGYPYYWNWYPYWGWRYPGLESGHSALESDD